MKKYHYVYRITNLKPFDERKYYIGVRSSICLPEQDTDYMSSSKSLKKIILEQPKENFKKEILTIWKNREEAVAEEIRLHNNFDVGNNRIFYNKAKQTSVSFSFDPSGLKKSKEHRKNLSKAILKKFEEDPSYKKRLSDITKKWHETNINPFKGKKHTLEARKKMSENHADFRKEKHPLWGTSPSKEARKKMSEAKKGKGFKPKTSKKLLLISPEGIEYKIYGALDAFCKEHNLGVEAIRQIYTKGKYPVRKNNRNYGWDVKVLY